MDNLHAFLRPLLLLTAIGVAAAGAMLASDQLWLAALGIIFLCLLYLIWSAVPRAAVRPRTALGGPGNPDDPEAARQAALARSVQLLAGFLLAGFLTLSVHLFRQQVTHASAIAHTVVTNTTEKVGDNLYVRHTDLLQPGSETIFTTTIQSSDDLTGSDTRRNPRQGQRERRVQRGRIFDAAGGEIAGRVVYSDTGYTRRTYPSPTESYLAGFYNPSIYGNSGLEASYDTYLGGESGNNPLVAQEDAILHRPVVGSDVYLTLQPSVQKAATDALGARKGAVVVLDIASGKVLALVTYPHFDPSGLAFDPGANDWNAENQRIIDYWNEVANEKTRPDLPMLNRATQGLYPPGSTFKTITAAAALDTGKASPATVFTDTGSLQVEAGGYKHVDCATCRPAGHPDPHFTLTEGYQWSLNVVFAELAVYALGRDPLVGYAEKFGFDHDYNADNPAMGVSVEASRLGDPAFLATPNGIAATSYGQGQVQATPLQMALVAATIAHGGELPQPYLVDRVVSPSGAVVAQGQPHSLGAAISPATAATMTEMMMVSVERGWASGAKIPGFQVGGKTGTAETGDANNSSHAWFIGVAGTDRAHPKYAVAAMVEKGGEGSRVAVPIGRAALLAALALK